MSPNPSLCASLRKAFAMMMAIGACSAGTAMAQPNTTLATAAAEPTCAVAALFARSWARQPEAQAAATRRLAWQAEREAAQAWTAQPPSVALQTKTDRAQRDAQGQREYEVGVSLPLWLPGERGRKQALGDAQLQAHDDRYRAAQWQWAAQWREAWWSYQRAASDAAAASERLQQAQALASDVHRRVQAGDLARADLLQAQAAVAQAQAAQAQSNGERDAARVVLASQTGERPEALAALLEAPSGEHCESAPALQGLDEAALLARHPALLQAQAQVQVAERAAALAAVQTRANPELTAATTRGRDQWGDRYRQTVTLGVRWPLGAGAQMRAKEAAGQADLLEAQTQAQRLQEQTAAQVAAARARWLAAQQQLQALAQAAALAQETRGFVDKAFRWGEADWPTRWRAEQDAVQAARQWARARTDAAAAASAWRQALGWLPGNDQ